MDREKGRTIGEMGLVRNTKTRGLMAEGRLLMAEKMISATRIPHVPDT